jgi:hypothetical protein
MCVIRSIWRYSCRQMQSGRQVGSERDIVRLITLTDTHTIYCVSEREEKREREIGIGRRKRYRNGEGE